jgi:transcription elongation factor Elf1
VRLAYGEGGYLISDTRERLEIVRRERAANATPPRGARLDFLLTCPICGTTRLVTGEQVRTGTWQRCPHCCGGSEAA